MFSKFIPRWVEFKLNNAGVIDADNIGNQVTNGGILIPDHTNAKPQQFTIIDIGVHCAQQQGTDLELEN
ncbi:hypothetical protein [Moorena sp. SIO3E8]|uniref:hypothetical protein n=1 Tax=Moorena sp. SIO3E8 TaxID=2607830 RepID=UPI0034523D81